jgi:hypothetical protein
MSLSLGRRTMQQRMLKRYTKFVSAPFASNFSKFIPATSYAEDYFTDT